MNKILISFGVLAVLAMSFASESFASPKGGFPKNVIQFNKGGVINLKPPVINLAPKLIVPNNVKPVANYYLKFGTKFSQGYLFQGKNHCHWHCCRYDVRYGCYLYFDQCLLMWFYWCEPDLCFYPITYAPYRVYVFGGIGVQPVVQVPIVAGPNTVVTPDPVLPADNVQTENAVPIPEPIMPVQKQ